ncbi:MAG: hypothetical protein G01um101424_25 [Parcubacteria group bacterium Gr01-1014_24]|nr:MAG: hypothetical protein G01um101424_25 [Parcubacteria group bacterium Gr01-1014_24]
MKDGKRRREARLVASKEVEARRAVQQDGTSSAPPPRYLPGTPRPWQPRQVRHGDQGRRWR